MIISALLLMFGARALILDPVGLVDAPASVDKRQASTGTLGGSAPTVTNTGDSERPYGVDGDTRIMNQQPREGSSLEFLVPCFTVPRGILSNTKSIHQLQQPIRLLPEANTDQSSSFSLQDCQDQLNSCMSTVSSTSVASQGATIASAPTTSSLTTDATTVTAQLAQTTIQYDAEFDLVCDL
ncbi:hypothetical protein BDV38DRAFT_284642 [Aspergillus pseudotamarii]|uniref:Uncharacterized protein n=1 Tax=Aspergillus pseudotamarii TaxID=132259 RepID=A0A5N6SMG9_ASPPS|nr:uncharacterized protein BDV38DRAFT_284642 [Aspergillus pseudotamarii]KAE8135765.1 hypothetical protein BDV38DRAFT_284642 [Aspergillus pseudotamarii]